jgi:hypothetical protein
MREDGIRARSPVTVRVRASETRAFTVASSHSRLSVTRRTTARNTCLAPPSFEDGGSASLEGRPAREPNSLLRAPPRCPLAAFSRGPGFRGFLPPTSHFRPRAGLLGSSPSSEFSPNRGFTSAWTTLPFPPKGLPLLSFSCRSVRPGDRMLFRGSIAAESAGLRRGCRPFWGFALAKDTQAFREAPNSDPFSKSLAHSTRRTG